MYFRVLVVNWARSGLVRQRSWRGAGGAQLVCAFVVLALVKLDGGFKQDHEK